MSTINEQPPIARAAPLSSDRLWQRRFFFVMTILGWLVLAAVVLWGIGKIIEPIILIGFSALLAYLIYPLVRFFARHMPRIVAIFVSLLLLLAVMGAVIYFVVAAAVQQFALLIAAIGRVIQHPERFPQLQALLNELGRFGISKDQLQISGQTIVGYLQSTIGSIVPILGGIFVTLLSLLLIATLSIYFMIDGPRINVWFRSRTPLKYRGVITLFLDELDRSLGGFVRGEVLLAVIMSVVMGIGAWIIGVPFVFLLAIVVFICEFIPQIGAYIAGAFGVILALTHGGWQPALIFAIYSSIMQGGLDGQILQPRILGHAVGLHPILSVFAILVGLVLFGLLGALFACPAAGIIQTFVQAGWRTWRERHPDHFSAEEDQGQSPAGLVGHDEHDQSAVST